MSANGVVYLPLVTILGVSGSIPGIAGVFSLPALSIQGVGASNGGGLVLPSLLISGTSNTQTLTCSGSMVLPLFSFTGTVGAQGGLVLPGFSLAGAGHCVSLASGGMTLGRILVLGTATPGQQGVGSLTLPLFTFAGTSHHVPHGVGSIVLPVFAIGGEGFALAGVVPAVLHSTIVVNTKYAAVSEYLEFNFDSYCEFPAGVFLAAGPVGLYQLYSDAGTDNGNLINAELEFGTTDFGEQTKKNCTDGFINYRGDGLVEINALADELEDPDIYRTKEPADSRLRNYKFKMSKFRNGKNWKFSVKNIEGSALDINEVAFFYDVLSRRI
jgi:hypothetical protein